VKTILLVFDGKNEKVAIAAFFINVQGKAP